MSMFVDKPFACSTQHQQISSIMPICVYDSNTKPTAPYFSAPYYSATARLHAPGASRHLRAVCSKYVRTGLAAYGARAT
eukprot:6214466-Pleurochrysis_carterae.AAC.5